MLLRTFARNAANAAFVCPPTGWPVPCSSIGEKVTTQMQQLG
jgi:hypothetical protein